MESSSTHLSSLLFCWMETSGSGNRFGSNILSLLRLFQCFRKSRPAGSDFSNNQNGYKTHVYTVYTFQVCEANPSLRNRYHWIVLWQYLWCRLQIVLVLAIDIVSLNRTHSNFYARKAWLLHDSAPLWPLLFSLRGQFFRLVRPRKSSGLGCDPHGPTTQLLPRWWSPRSSESWSSSSCSSPPGVWNQQLENVPSNWPDCWHFAECWAWDTEWEGCNNNFF